LGAGKRGILVPTLSLVDGVVYGDSKSPPLSFQLLLGDRYEDGSGQSRISIVLLLLLLLTPHIEAKNKKKQLLPDYVLRAERVLVVIQPDAGEPLTSPRPIELRKKWRQQS
jgi:hypothetical protein